ncbi:Elongation of very long chain fatty acids protein 7 [Nymphon striatum]|nr:Elongation of very long chain fatty acids protein 7 [Nymphon striatum]
MEAINATLTLALDLYQSIVDSGDPRTQHFVGVHSPCPTVLITLIYLFLVFQLIPWYMKDKEPFDLRTPMFIYNAVVAGISASHFYLLGVYGWFGKYDFRCVPEDLSINPLNLMMVNLSWLYWVMKIVELLDTIFFALRKKRSQITFLHVYHHTIMILCSWYVIKFSAVGHASFVGFTNSLVHAVMYAYYGLASMGPHMKKYLWWKRYLTKMQLVNKHAVTMFKNDYAKVFVGDVMVTAHLKPIDWAKQ